jgi:hypothetical protein
MILWADSIDELTQRLDKVMDRARKYKLTFNPTKCEFGMRKIEFVGHVFDESGHTFHPSKLKKAYEFKQPKAVVEMHHF